jgi:hypothetical protein
MYCWSTITFAARSSASLFNFVKRVKTLRHCLHALLKAPHALFVSVMKVLDALLSSLYLTTMGSSGKE